MEVTQQDLSESRPPPKRDTNFSLTTPGIPWYRDLRVLRIIAQIVFVIIFVGSLVGLVSNLLTNLNQSNLSLDFRIYSRPFTVAITEGISLSEDWQWIDDTDTLALIVGIVWVLATAYAAYSTYRHFQKSNDIPYVRVVILGVLILFILISPPAETAETLSATLNDYLFGGSMTRAFVTGIYNTLRVVVVSLIASTLLGILVGIGLLSSNFLLRSTAKVFVEIFRNTPLLVQLFFIFRTLTLVLPFPRQSIYSPSQIGPITLENNLYAINARGFYFASPVAQNAAWVVFLSILIALVAGWYVRRRRMRYQTLTGNPANTWRIVLPMMLGIVIMGWILAAIIGGGSPFTVDYPALQGPNIQGGTQLTIGFMSLFVGLTLYTSAFIAEIVRAGIQAVPYGQIEAARAQGLSGGQVLNLVVLPQALRLIIPPLGNQYVNLGKNSSLGIIVNYADTFRIAQIANNESGQAVPFFVGLMVIYLTLSLTLSVMTNFVNRATRMKTR